MDSKSAQFTDEEIRQSIEKTITDHSAAIKDINYKIFNNAELAWHESTAHDAICDYFESLGSDYKVHRHAYDIDTSFLIEVTTRGTDDTGTNHRTVAYNAEYDALPNMVVVPDMVPPKYKSAHACGHNLIASASIAAFVACWEMLKMLGLPGTVKLLGTPAEESGGGKIKLLQYGAYTNVDACIMAHPGPLASDKDLRALAFTRSLASQRLVVDFEGLASHAGIAPWDGRNALDAFVNSYVAISALRQQLHPSLRVAGIIKDGGKAANIIPDHSRAEYSIRAPSRKDLDDLRHKVTRCFESGGQAAGCTTKVNDTRAAYWDIISNPSLCQDFTKRMNEFGVKTVYKLPEITDNPGAASDQGNVSHFCPAMQAAFFIESGGAVNHTPAFVKAAGTEDAFMRAINCAKGLAAVGLDVLVDGRIAKEVQESYASDISAKAATVAREFGKEVPSQDQITGLLESLPPLAQALLKAPGVSKEQVIAALMAVDVYFDEKKGLF
ncbi:hypothetical protein B0I35DRAFT_445231 [Stachybotrys elegans]|uniref:Peptidase M20 dimerisation domain-containing protein n=1 Tax=Stachybotrys elegans TaxID=80388 RepID=A0A8K0SHQ2_9HYPO|nr:hypothetical protein B0I35DRAFT_445231 [Stachybotrys elegans]